MFGSEIVSTALYTELMSVPEVAAAIGTRLQGGMVLSQGTALPAALFYPEFSSYAGPLGTRESGFGAINYESMRYAVRLMCQGASTDPIVVAAKAQLDHLDGLSVDAVVDGVNHYITFTANGEVLPTDISDGATPYRQLGTIYLVEIIKGA